MKNTRGAYLAVPVAIEPVDDARALGAKLERHRGQVLGGLRHDEAADTAAACETPEKRPSSGNTFRQRMQGLSVASSSSLFRELLCGRIILPVKRTLSHLCSMSFSPTSAPPSTTFTALGSRYFGMLAARNAEVDGASSDGFTTTALPAAKAPESGSRARPA
jgi:hypothetical protein